MINSFGDSIDVFIVVPILIPFCRFIYLMMNEKETRIKEYMKIMGLNEAAYYVSWVVHYETIFMIIGLSITWCVKTAIFIKSNAFLLFLWQMVCYQLWMARAFFFCSLFTKARNGVSLGLVSYFIE
jgi:ATP-binding cassette subfamily A (ABC1) protein 3